jgi:hypothetical protein
MIRSIRLPVRAAAVAVFVSLVAIAAVGCDDKPDPATKLPGTWQVNDFSNASSSAKFMFSLTVLDLKPNKAFRIRPRVHGPNDELLTFEGNWQLDGSTLTLSISSAPEQLATATAGKVMTLEVSPNVDRLTMTGQSSSTKLVFERTQ